MRLIRSVYANCNSAIVESMTEQTGEFYKKTCRELPLEGKTVLVRVDYNVPLSESGTIMDDYRIRASIPTINYLVEQRCKIVLCAHLGRPDGKINTKESLEPIAEHLSDILQKSVEFVDESIGDKVLQAAKNLSSGQILLLENLRFHTGEEANDPEFASQLAKSSHAEYFIQDGFGVVHRAHASTEGITHYLPSAAGLLLEKEYCTITRAMENPARPLTALLGGAKVSDKIKVIERFVDIADRIVIGGAMANTFLKYKGFKIGKSIHEDGFDDVMGRIYEKAAAKAENVDEFIVLPVDVAVAPKISSDEHRKVVDIENVGDDEMILDIGNQSIEVMSRYLEGSKTIVWNGTLGYAELEQFAYGSAKAAETMAQGQGETATIIGGGDTADFALHWDEKQGGSFDHVSTGGGASIELMSGKKLPGIEALLDA